MTWLRQYLVLRAGNRIDAGARGVRCCVICYVFPCIFENRRTGVLVARCMAWGTPIREFVSGAAVTLVLDSPSC